MKIIQILMLSFLTSCGMISLPDEHIEVEFDMKSTSVPKYTPKEIVNEVK